MVSSTTVSAIAKTTAKVLSSTATSKIATKIVSTATSKATSKIAATATSKLTATATSAAAKATSAAACHVIKQVTFCANNITLVYPNFNGTFIAQADCTLQTCSMFLARWGYLPNIPANAFFMAIFAIVTVASIPLGVWKKTWGILAGIFIGGIFETIGTLGRIQAASNPFIFNPFLLYIVMLTIGPSFLSAAIYLCLSRIIVVYGEGNARFKPRTYSLVFMFSDFVALVLQGGGGGIAATSKDDANKAQMGTNIMLAGLAWQVVSLTVFAAACWDFSRTYKQGRFPPNPVFNQLRQSQKWKGFLWSLAAATALIYVRSVYRCAELTEGFSGAIADLEIPYMIFEPTMISLACVCLLAFHPSYVFGDLWVEADYRKKKDTSGTLEYGIEAEKEIKEKKSSGLAIKIFRPRKRQPSIKRWSNPHVHKSDCPNNRDLNGGRNPSFAHHPPPAPAPYETNLHRGANADWDTNARTPLLTAYNQAPRNGSQGSISHYNAQLPHSASVSRRASDKSDYSTTSERDMYYGGARSAMPAGAGASGFGTINYGGTGNTVSRRQSEREVSPHWTSAHQQPGGLYPMSARPAIGGNNTLSVSERDAERWVQAHQAAGAYPRTATLAPRTPFGREGGKEW